MKELSQCVYFKQLEIICMQWFTREVVSTSINTWSILVTPLSNEKCISKTYFLCRERIKLFVLVKPLSLLRTVLCVAASQTEIELLVDKIVLMSLPLVTYRKTCVCLQAAFLCMLWEVLCLWPVLDRKVKSSSGGRRIDLLRAATKNKVLQNFPSKGAKHSLLNEDSVYMC